MSYEFINVDQSNHITTVNINRPERMNALHPYAAIEMNEVFDNFESDPEQWVAIITGTGEKAFSAGNGAADASEQLNEVAAGCALPALANCE